MSEEKFTFKKLNEQIAESINGTANGSAVDTIVAKRTQAEVTRRADILEAALDKYNSTVAQGKKLGPDLHSMVTVEGSDVPVKHSAYSEKQWKEKDNNGKTVAAFEIAFLKIFGKDAPAKDVAEGYQKLQELTKQSKPE